MLATMAHSLKTKYLLIALAVSAVLAVMLGGLAFYEHRVNTRDANQLTYATVAHTLEADLESRAESLSKITSSSLAPPLAAGTRSAVNSIAGKLLDEHDIERVEVLDAHDSVLFSAANPASRPTVDGPYVLQTTIRSNAPAVPGTRVGSLQIWMSRAELQDTLASIRTQLLSHQGVQVKRIRGVFTFVALPLLILGLVGAWLIARQLSRPISALIKSADRIGEGDYTRPFAVVRHDELGDLQFALERMRQKLNETTINKNYLNTVLNSLSDAVLVTSPDGIVKSANEATRELLGYADEELVDKPVVSFIDEPHRAAFEATDSLTEARETVLRTSSGQTIPVSMACSPIDSEDPQFQGNIYVARNITERKRAERRIRYLARYDTLTKMPNRMQFQHLLQQAIARARRNGRSLALLYFDLDRFKEVNDTFGHAAGDRTLEILSERLTRNVSKDAVIGRLAGDEFAMFIDDLPMDDNRANLGALVRTLLDEISRTFYVNQQEVYLTASAGVAICPNDAENVIDLIRNADAAMYHSKQNGGNSCVFYVPEMNAAAVERLMLKSKLRRALERDELVILYQSKVDLRSGKVVGAEALLRWRLPGHGDISPSRFIPLAEESSLIMEIGDWVLNRVCADYREWQRVVREPGRIAINLSLRQLKQSSFISRCRAVFRRHEVSPTCFELEVTETTLMTDPKRTIGLLNELYAMGLNLAIDDFGTGYSSLSALQQFPIGTLKIDQSFVRDVAIDSNDAAIVRTIIDMGKSLDLEVIAEGVEAQEQLEFLRDHGCYYAQGRLFGEPMEAHELLGILADQVAGSAHHSAVCDTRPVTSLRLTS
jgi:diguanylate cyclase (GGDEF)-like protein/PAS domain S-box-containing protein